MQDATGTCLKSLPFLMGVVILSACASFDTSPPDELTAQMSKITETRENFRNAPFTALNISPVEIELAWWTGFDDPQLDQLVQSALENNAQLLTAQSRIELADAITARQTLLRSYSTSSSASLSNTATLEPDNDIETSARAGIGGSWEFDAYDRFANIIKAAELDVDAIEQARRDISVDVAVSTVLAYTNLRGAQARLAVAQDNAEAQGKTLELLRARLENGRATELDVSRAEAQYRTTLSSLPQFQATIDQSISLLALLTGQSVSTPESALTALSSRTGSIPVKPQSINIGTPEDLLRRRPDIRQAEIEISRQLALNEAERARLFPRLTFNAELFTLLNINTLFARPSTVGANFGPSIVWEGPDLRGVRADIDVSDARVRLAVATYRETVQAALADVEIALSNIANEFRRREDLAQAVNAARTSQRLAQLRFEEGVDDFLDVLDSQRTLLDTEDRLVQNELQTTRLIIAAYRELAAL